MGASVVGASVGGRLGVSLGESLGESLVGALVVGLLKFISKTGTFVASPILYVFRVLP